MASWSNSKNWNSDMAVTVDDFNRIENNIQYIMETKANLDGSTYPNNTITFTKIAAKAFDGNATSASKATQDGNGNTIASTYLTKASPNATGVFSVSNLKFI